LKLKYFLAFYGVVNSKTGQNVDIYDKVYIKPSKEEDYSSRAELERDGYKNDIEIKYFYSFFDLFFFTIEYLTERLVTIESENFSGYLVDNFQPYNMYLKAGIGSMILFFFNNLLNIIRKS
jgi:hypothetical protein